MNILLTNDDGWDAQGLTVLQDVVRDLGDVWVVAPEYPMSGISHQITFEKPLTLTQRRPKVFSLSGTPADCVRIAVSQLDVEFDWVFSGINNGANLGSDIYVSGTVAATREAALHGCQSIAFSQHRRKFKRDFDWTETERMAREVLDQALAGSLGNAKAAPININFPDRYHVLDGQTLNGSLEVIQCKIDRNPLPIDFKKDAAGNFIYCSEYARRPRSPGCDIDVCFSGKISVSRINL